MLSRITTQSFKKRSCNSVLWGKKNIVTLGCFFFKLRIISPVRSLQSVLCRFSSFLQTFKPTYKPVLMSTAQPIPRFLPKFLHRYVGNGTLFPFLKQYEQFYVVRTLNSVYNLAPFSKWGLSIVPLYGVFVGSPPVEKIDLNTSASLTVTGIIWTIYASIIQPQNSGSRALVAVNFCMASVNGFNCYRKLSFVKQSG